MARLKDGWGKLAWLRGAVTRAADTPGLSDAHRDALHWLGMTPNQKRCHRRKQKKGAMRRHPRPRGEAGESRAGRPASPD
jgi:hypothetical protein